MRASGVPSLRVVGHDGEIAGADEPETAGERMTVDAGDHRHRAAADRAEQLDHRIVDFGRIDAERVAARVGLEIAAGAEHLAGAR